MELLVTLSDEKLQLIGLITAHWGYLDFMLSEALRGLSGASEEEANKTIRRMDVEPKIECIKRLVKSQISNQSDATRLRTLLTKIKAHTQDRNLVAHGIIAYRQKTSDEPIYISFRGKHRLRSQPVKESYLRKILDDTVRLS